MNRIGKALRSAAWMGACISLSGGMALAEVTSTTHGGEVTLQSQSVTVHVHTRTGKMDIVWRDGHKLMGIESGAELADGRTLLTSTYTAHTLEKPRGTQNGEWHEFTISNTAPNQPALLQHIRIADSKPWITVDAELDRVASAIGTRHFDTILLKGASTVEVKKDAALRVLHVPFDNDMWFRFESKPVGDIKTGELFSSEEVTAIYDNASREGIVLGSIAHDVWKTAIDVRADGGHIGNLDIYGGILSPTGVRTDTHDTVPHGLVYGAKVTSPRIFIGSFSDWRDGLDTYGQANAAAHPPLVWPDGAPMGWNSWAAYADKINDRRYLGAAEFMHDVLVPQGFGRKGVVYLNLDAFWSSLDAVQLADAVATFKTMQGTGGVRFEPGIYWTPFAYWSDDLDQWVEGTNMKYRYRDILLKAPDGSYLPKVDGGRAIDPTHPGAKARVTFYMKQFQQMGFHYLKLDFLSHGMLEGVHYDHAVQTGVEAYNQGMQQIVDEAGNHMFLSLSIAPLFPSGYGHARRLSCDTKGHINGNEQSTEYMLNSLTYGWWTNKNLYLVDPDHVVLGEKADQGARNVTEGKSRLLSAIISGGMILDSSRIADDPQGRELARVVYNNRSLLAVADEGKAFRPVEGDSGNKATNVFTSPSAHGVYLAVFNYDDKQPQKITVPLTRIDAGLIASKTVTVVDVATGQRLGTAQDAVEVQLQPAESKLLELRIER